mgnify:CR=1 FL=1
MSQSWGQSWGNSWGQAWGGEPHAPYDSWSESWGGSWDQAWGHFLVPPIPPIPPVPPVPPVPPIPVGSLSTSISTLLEPMVGTVGELIPRRLTPRRNKATDIAIALWLLEDE